MQQTHVNRFSKGFLTLVAILLAFVLLLVTIWLWYDLRLKSLEQRRNDQDQPSTHITP